MSELDDSLADIGDTGKIGDPVVMTKDQARRIVRASFGSMHRRNWRFDLRFVLASDMYFVALFVVALVFSIVMIVIHL